ncbi:MAG: radical SAM family heme chaperone HemW [Chitinophagales bacterium]
MSGIYIHIPFCKQACHYCNFHFSTSLKYKNELIAALLQEIELRKDYLPTPKIETVYFGGGTPSLLSADEIQQIFEQLNRFYHIEADAEITLEANPDDLLPAKIEALKQTPVNRFSIGIQSFDAEDLAFMNRAHNVEQAETCIRLAQDAGFDNLTIDLIYGAPTTSHEKWEQNLQKAIDFGVPHISAYCLTVEPKTALAHFVATGKAADVDEEQAAQQFEVLVETLTQAGFSHYEISNFGKVGWESKHNSSYWMGKPYIGLGPAAHSFDGRLTRQWNVAHNQQYIKAIAEGTVPKEVEVLSISERFNEYLMTSLRTIWGCDLEKVRREFGEVLYCHLLKEIQPFLKQSLLQQKGDFLVLTNQGKFLADGIISALFDCALD